MPRSASKSWFRGLALYFGGLVLVLSVLTAGVMTWFSVRSIQSFLEARIERRYPEALHRVGEHLDHWYGQRERDLVTFASRKLLDESIRRGDPAARHEVERYLGYVLERSPQYASLVLLDDSGEVWMQVGEAGLLDDDMRRAVAQARTPAVSAVVETGTRRVQIVSAPLEAGESRSTLHGVLPIEALEDLLELDDVLEGASLAVIDAAGRPLAGSRSAAAFELDAMQEDDTIAVTHGPDGERLVVAAMGLPRFDWTLLAHQPYDQAFAPVSVAVRRTLMLNGIVVAAAGLLAYALGAWRARPILALADGAARLAAGESDVAVPVSRGADEVQELARAFNHMSASLRESRLELEARNHELTRANEVLEQLSITDGLTKLHNHRYFQDSFQREARRSRRSGEPVALALLDIDDFKALNDEFGHAAGDSVLESVASILSQAVRETDYLCRYGGEEFAVLAPGTDAEGALVLADKLRESVAAARFDLNGRDTPLQVTVSCGVSLFDGDTLESFEMADRALYAAKQAGKDCVRWGGGQDELTSPLRYVPEVDESEEP